MEQAADPAGPRPRTGRAQRHPEAAIAQRQPQQRLSVLDFPRPREGATRPRRGFHVKTRRKARAHFRPMIQNLRANLHPKLESYQDSSCPELNLAQMRVGVRGCLHEYRTRGGSPSPEILAMREFRPLPAKSGAR